MHALLLGTGAADIHAPDQCSCPNCTAVRQRGGRSRRTYSSTLFDHELLVDCGATVPTQLDRLAPDARIAGLLFTHPDADHFDPEAIARIIDTRAASECIPALGSAPVIARLWELPRSDVLDLYPIAPGESRRIGPWTVTALPARHRGAAGDSLIYILTRAEHNLLYATDTGPLLADAWDILRSRRLHAVIAEATFGPHTHGIPDLRSAHMNFPLLCELRNTLKRIGILAEAAPFAATHLSLHFCPPYEESDNILAACGIRAGYDGMELVW